MSLTSLHLTIDQTVTGWGELAVTQGTEMLRGAGRHAMAAEVGRPGEVGVLEPGRLAVGFQGLQALCGAAAAADQQGGEPAPVRRNLGGPGGSALLARQQGSAHQEVQRLGWPDHAPHKVVLQAPPAGPPRPKKGRAPRICGALPFFGPKESFWLTRPEKAYSVTSMASLP